MTKVTETDGGVFVSGFVARPWGGYTVLEDEQNSFKIKRLTVMPGKKLSDQMHLHRSEHWVVVKGIAEVTIAGKTELLLKGESTFVGTTVRHRLGNPGIIPLEVIEVSLGEYIAEDDITRFEE